MSTLNFFWGNRDPEDPRIFGLGVLFGWAVNCAALYFFLPHIVQAQPALSDNLSLDAMRGLIWVTLGWFWSYFSAMGAQVLSKERIGDDEDAVHIADRSMLNTLEHAIPSLFLIWLVGIYSNVFLATVLGSVYVLGRLMYPILYGWYGQFTMLVEFSTHLGYFALGTLYLALLGTMLWEPAYLLIHIQNWYLPLVVLLGWLMYLGVQMFLFGWIAYVPVYERGARWKKSFDAESERIAEDAPT